MATNKRPSPSASAPSDLGPPEKKFKSAAKPGNENPAGFSDSVRRKLQAASRTGQACDRCKERKMRCDPNPLGCGPCKQKNLPCVTTDRISGRPSERGHIERLENEIHTLRQQLGSYISKYGQMEGIDYSVIAQQQQRSTPVPGEPGPSYQLGSEYANDSSQTQDFRLLSDFMNPSPMANKTAPPPQSGPIRGTKVDVMGSEIDIADFECEEMDEPTSPLPEGGFELNNSRISFINSIMGRSKPPIPTLPEKETALTYARYYNSVVGPYSPVLHTPSFLRLVERMYEKNFRPTAAENVMFFVVLAIITHQMAVRNPSMAKAEFEKSYKYFHYCLSLFADLIKDDKLSSLQAMTMLLIHARNLPKPGFSWNLSKMVLTRAVEMNLHRSATKLAPFESHKYNPLEIELRKRIFWVIMKKVVTSGVKLGRPMPIEMADLDIEFPEPLLDAEISEHGISEHRSGRCDFWVGLHIMRQTPLWLDLYNNIIKIRLPAAEYVKCIELLDSKMAEWKAQCDKDFSHESMDGNLQVATYNVETWNAEFRLLLHHPSLCTSTSPEVIEKNVQICHESALSLLRGVLALFEKFKGADFTWHSTVSYVLAAGMSIEYHSSRKQYVTPESYKAVQHELQEWLKIMRIAGAVLGSGDQLVKFFKRRCDTCLRESQSVLIASTAFQNGLNQEVSQQPKAPPTPHKIPTYGQLPPQSSYSEPTPSQATSSNPRRSSISMSGEHLARGQSFNQPPSSYTPHYDHPSLSVHGHDGEGRSHIGYGNEAMAASASNQYHPMSTPTPVSSQSMMYSSLMTPYGPGSMVKQEHQQHSPNSLLDLSQYGMTAMPPAYLDDTSSAAMWPNIIFQNGP